MLLKLRSSFGAGTSQLLIWNTPAVPVLREYFTLSADQRTVTVLKDGCYNVSVRLGVQFNNNNAAVHLKLNGADVAKAPVCNANSHLLSANIQEYFILKSGDTLSVTHTGNTTQTNGDQLTNCFSILLM